MVLLMVIMRKKWVFNGQNISEKVHEGSKYTNTTEPHKTLQGFYTWEICSHIFVDGL